MISDEEVKHGFAQLEESAAGEVAFEKFRAWIARRQVERLIREEEDAEEAGVGVEVPRDIHGRPRVLFLPHEMLCVRHVPRKLLSVQMGWGRFGVRGGETRRGERGGVFCFVRRRP